MHRSVVSKTLLILFSLNVGHYDTIDRIFKKAGLIEQPPYNQQFSNMTPSGIVIANEL